MFSVPAPGRRSVISFLALGILAGAGVYLFATRPVMWVIYWGPFMAAPLPYSDQAYQSTKTGAQALVQMIEAHRQENGEYPATLADLQDSVTPPLVGLGKWEYRRPQPDRFTLTFLIGPSYENDYFDSAIGEWRIDR